VFSEHKNETRFARFAHKLVHLVMPAPAPNTPPFTYENAHRHKMTSLLDSHNVHAGDLVVMSDVDEIPSAASLRLLRGCSGWGTRIHLSMRAFLYSFEWELVTPAWRAALQVWGPGEYYGHSPREDGHVTALADAGWHCRCSTSSCARWSR
jgi:beta-1,4-mannosyl-glycoprotein beta-1,4-N-acetylglucosaminyltransferase